MFTNQWSAWLHGCITTSSSTSCVYPPSGSCKDVDGVEVASVRYSGSKIDEYLESSGSVVRGFIFGTGSTAPAKTDYCLASPCGSEIVQVSQTHSYAVNSNGKYTYTRVVNLRNDGTTSVTIREVGLKTLVEGATSRYVLVWRDVLSSPVTLGAGESKNIEIQMDFPI